MSKNHLRLVLISTLFTLLSACANSELPKTEESYSYETPSKKIDLGYSTATKTATHGSSTPTTTSLQPTPTPSHALSQSGPWLLLRSGEDLLIANSDGSALINANMYKLWLDHRNSFSAAPNDGLVAIKGSDDELLILGLPDLSIELITRVVNPNTDFSSETPDYWNDTYASLYFLPNMAWSSSGDMLVFIARIDGQSTDLYLYNLKSEEITRLTSGSTFALLPEWSPDYDFIVHDAATEVYWGSSGRGYSISSVWAASPNSATPILLFDSQLTPGRGYEQRLGWLSDSVYLASTEPELCSQTDLRTVSLAGAPSVSVWEGSFFDAVFDPRSMTVLVYVQPEEFQWLNAGCDTSMEPGFYLTSLETGKKLLVDGLDLAEFYYPTVAWSPDANLFFIQGDKGLYSVKLDGQVEEIAASRWGIPNVSPDGQFWAIEDQSESPFTGVIIRGIEGDTERIFSGDVRSLSWAPDSNTLFFIGSETEDDDVFSLYISEKPLFSPENLSERYGYPEDWRLSFLTWVEE